MHRQKSLQCSVFLLAAFALVVVCGCPSKKENKPLPDVENATDADSKPVEPAVDSGVPTEPEESSDNDSVKEEDLPTTDQAAEDTEPPDPLKAGSWTSKRIVLLAPAGPTLVEILMSIEGDSLAASSSAVIAELANELLTANQSKRDDEQMLMQKQADTGDVVQSEESQPREDVASTDDSQGTSGTLAESDQQQEGVKTWQQLLANELISSGWLGNLIAGDDREDDLISMYDDGDGIVTAAELEPFLTRGLNRQGPVIFSDRSGDSDTSGSPWGYGDLDNDFSLSFSELDEFSESIRKYDLNGDSIVGLAEVTRSATSNDMSMMGRSMLALNSAIELPVRELKSTATSEELTDEQTKKVSQAAKEILQHYTFLSSIEREVWSGWSDTRWNMFDTNDDNQINRNELTQLLVVEPDLQIAVRLPTAVNREGLIFGANTGVQDWNQSKTAGMHGGLSSRTRVVIEDAFSASAADNLKAQLALALSNSQLQEVIRRQLDLQENAFDVLDADKDKMLSDEEFEAAWKWLSIRNSGRVMIQLELATERWLHLIDIDGDDRISDHEVAMAKTDLRSLDRDGDEMIAPVEIPMTVTLRLRRQEDRIDVNFIPSPQSEGEQPEAMDWFAAMDTNQDGSISRAEFLGSEDDFAELDGNSDRFIERQELVP